MVTWTLPAKNDLKQVYDYIAKDSKYYAEKVSNEIVEKSETLNHLPQMGRIVPEVEESNICECFIHSYRLIYRISPEEIEILALVHGKRDYLSGKLDKLKI